MIKKLILITSLLTIFVTANNKVVELRTSEGNILVEIYTDNYNINKTTNNFLKLSENGYYNGTIFHRVIHNFMIQGGDPTGTGRGGESIYGYPFEDEIDKSLTFSRPGVLAMANAGKNTNGSQFFITTRPTAWLNGKHTIFGKVISGWDVIERIERVKKNRNDKPIKDIVIKEINING